MESKIQMMLMLVILKEFYTTVPEYNLSEYKHLSKYKKNNNKILIRNTGQTW